MLMFDKFRERGWFGPPLNIYAHDIFLDFILLNLQAGVAQLFIVHV